MLGLVLWSERGSWTQQSDDAHKLFSNLPPREYFFRVVMSCMQCKAVYGVNGYRDSGFEPGTNMDHQSIRPSLTGSRRQQQQRFAARGRLLVGLFCELPLAHTGRKSSNIWCTAVDT